MRQMKIVVFFILGVCGDVVNARNQQLGYSSDIILKDSEYVTCSNFTICWQCVESEHDCVFDSNTNLCVQRDSGDESSITQAYNCMDGQTPDFFSDYEQCLQEHLGNNIDQCQQQTNFNCSLAPSCQLFYDCVLSAIRQHDGEPCGFENSRITECNAEETIIDCYAGSVDDCECGTLISVDPDRSCNECLYELEVDFQESCPPGCNICARGGAENSCYVCDENLQHVPMNLDCTGQCVVDSGSVTGVACLSPCLDICGEEEADLDTDDDTEEQICYDCLAQAGARTGSCHVGDEDNNIGECLICGFSQNNDDEVNGIDDCVVCVNEEDYVLDITNEAECTGRCVPRDQAANPVMFAECRFDPQKYPCRDECDGEEDEDLNESDRICRRCLFTNGAHFASEGDCFNQTGSYGGCLACGFGENPTQASDCLLCPEGYELDVLSTNSGCSGLCVPINRAENPLYLALATNDCVSPCENECFDAKNTGLDNEIAKKCYDCLDDQNFEFGLANCYESSTDPVVYDPNDWDTFSDFCAAQKASPGSCGICRGESSSNCIMCADENYEIDVEDYIFGTGRCVPIGCAEIPLRSSTSRSPCIPECLVVFEGLQEQRRTEESQQLMECDSLYTLIRGTCTVDHPTVSGDLCPDSNPDDDCCRLLIILEAFEGCSNRFEDILPTSVLSSCDFNAPSTRIISSSTCNSVDVSTRSVIMNLDGWTRAIAESDSGKHAIFAAMTRLTEIEEGKMRIVVLSSDDSSVQIRVKFYSESSEIEDIDEEVEAQVNFETIINEEITEINSDTTSSLPMLDSMSFGEISNTSDIARSSGPSQYRICETLHLTTDNCSSAESATLQTCHSTNGMSCEAALEETVRANLYDLICQDEFSDFGECCETNVGQSFEAVCEEVSEGDERNQLCTYFYSEDNCQGDSTQLCATFSMSCEQLLDTQSENLRDICPTFSEYGECCAVGDGTSATVQCSPVDHCFGLNGYFAFLISIISMTFLSTAK